jgi:radical SAM superfamily enzyme YgiQ (UPF0313 family)
MGHRFIDPVQDLGKKLLQVEKPARYSGGEYGSIARREAALRMVIAFPDLYEIGMSNQALRIIYNALNGISGISCDRAFAPAPDFERLLEQEGIPLYGLDTGVALGDTDILCFTVGYELGLTGLLTMLHASGIPLRASAREERHPVVIMGGPCVSNPLPFSLFADAFWIGEAEAGFFDLCEQLLQRKQAGAGKADILSLVTKHYNVWTPGKTGVRRAVYSGFGQNSVPAAVFPVSNIRTVQQHGSVEIMRGCPNGCRFCHAGIWYRPMRQKQASLVMREVEEFVNAGGYREISLSSLSSGDYCHIHELVSSLNSHYAPRHVSFQLPSLRVSSFFLPLLEDMSEVRKSGLTFAVETPLEMWQLSINKIVKLEEVVSILKEAKRRGWRGAKFYFMIGLPLGNHDGENTAPSEEEAVVDFIKEAARQSRSHFHVTVGTFVPKPHTPYERAAQLDEDEARRRIAYITPRLKSGGHKISVHDPFTAKIEGFIARGEKEAGEIAERAFLMGARLDPWSEFFRRDIWQALFSENRELVNKTLAGNSGVKLPWSVVESGTSEIYLKSEQQKSESRLLTSSCIKNCTHHCGICLENASIVQNIIQDKVKSGIIDSEKISGCRKAPSGIIRDAAVYRMLFSFEKTGPAIFTPHLGVIEVFSMAFTRLGNIPYNNDLQDNPGDGGEGGLRPLYTQGFNPHLRLEFASPAAVGVICLNEIACVDFPARTNQDNFPAALNVVLPMGFKVKRAELFAIASGAKKYSLSSLLYGFRYGNDYVKAANEKSYRREYAGKFFPVRDDVLALGSGNSPINPVFDDYFSAYKARCSASG